ncbi:hypothetical protein Taro_001912, partial [Colocasia esculenta]|nr:hypothetical protein [Colocasia esculenta]
VQIVVSKLQGLAICRSTGARFHRNPRRNYSSQRQGVSGEGLMYWRRRGEKNPRRLIIGSTAPTCSYNECRGCRFKCRAEQVPVDANDPINSAYHYRCVCHR